MAKPRKETAQHKAAFDFYLSLGADRSLSKVRIKFGISDRAVENWSKAFDWQNRIIDRETKIAAMVSEKVDSQLADFNAKLITVGDAVLGLFVKRINGALDEDGNLKPRGYKPSALDAKIWAELKRDILTKAGISDTGSGGINLAAAEGMSSEIVERIIIERVKRFSRSRGAGDQGGGNVGMAAHPRDP